jgi:DNA-binding transcriptional LysR family regulator
VTGRRWTVAQLQDRAVELRAAGYLFTARSVEVLAESLEAGADLDWLWDGPPQPGGVIVLGVPVSAESAALLASVEEFRSAPAGTANAGNLLVPFAGEGGSCHG